MTNNRTTKANVAPKPAPTTETKPVPAVETKPAPAAETKPVPAAETKPVPEAETKPVPEAETKPVPAVIVFGVDQANRRIAASFPADQVELATKAAQLMRLRVLKVASAELTELADQPPLGRICTVSPAQSTNSLSPARWVCRIVGARRRRHSP
jgi:outer membrane biosynthesis protein TonB